MKLRTFKIVTWVLTAIVSLVFVFQAYFELPASWGAVLWPLGMALVVQSWQPPSKPCVRIRYSINNKRILECNEREAFYQARFMGGVADYPLRVGVDDNGEPVTITLAFEEIN